MGSERKAGKGLGKKKIVAIVILIAVACAAVFFAFHMLGVMKAREEAKEARFAMYYNDVVKNIRFDMPLTRAQQTYDRLTGPRTIDPKKPMVAITYDDGPNAKTTPQLLDIYEKNGAVCTFFELGQNVSNIPESSAILKRELKIGCEIGTHSNSHPDLLTLSADQVKAEAAKSKAAISKATGGYGPTVMRPPYGNGSEEISKIFGLPAYNWDVDTKDWYYRDKDKVIDYVKSIKNLDGSIVLMHSIYQPTVDATEVLVPWLIDQGYQLVTVSELAQYKYNRNPATVKYYGYSFK